MTLEFWYLFPVAVAIATVAMASGVEGATFFAPIFLLALGLPPETAVGAGLITEVFGFASGLSAYVKKGLVDYALARMLLVVTVPAAIAGSLVVHYVRSDILEAILGMGLIAVAISFLTAPDEDEVERLDSGVAKDAESGPEKAARSVVTTADGEEIRYEVCNRLEGRVSAGIGALFMGMISTGLGELNGYFLIRRCRVPSKVAVATGVLVVAVSALSAAGTHLWRFVQAGDSALDTVLNICLFTVPGVIVGGQIGPKVAARISQHVLERGLAALFMGIGLLMLGKVAF